MIETIITSLMSFISTNIDNLFILLLLYAGANNKKGYMHITLGQYLGTGVLVLISILGSMGTSILPSKYIPLLGIIPIILGIRYAYLNITNESNKVAQMDNSFSYPNDTIYKGNKKSNTSTNLVSVALLTIANGADNIGVYIPIFTNYNLVSYLIMGIVFILSTGLLCMFGVLCTSRPRIKKVLEAYQSVLVPSILIILGFIILFVN